jgi:hypothetical protein
MPPAPLKHAIVCYSRDGHTDRLAQHLANALAADLFRIECRRYGGSVLGYALAGFDSLTGRLPAIDPIPDLSGYASVSLGAPIWTSYTATPLRAYLATRPPLPDTVGLFTTSSGHTELDKACSMVRETLGKPFAATLNVPNSLDQKTTDTLIAQYCMAVVLASGAAPST